MRALRKSTHLSRQLVAVSGTRYNSTTAPAAKALTSVLIANRGEIALLEGSYTSKYSANTLPVVSAAQLQSTAYGQLLSIPIQMLGHSMR